MTNEPTQPRLTDSAIVDALRALGIHSVRTPGHSTALSDNERAYLLGSLLFVVESEVSDYMSKYGQQGDADGVYEVMAHAARGHAHMTASMSGTAPEDTPDGMPRDVAPAWWLILADRLHLLSVQFVAAQDFGGSAMTNTPAAEQLVGGAEGLSQIITALAALNYRMDGVKPSEALRTLSEGGALLEEAGEFLRSTSQAALSLKPRKDGPA